MCVCVSAQKAAYRPYAGSGKTLLPPPPGLMSPADPYGMMRHHHHHHVPEHHLHPYKPGLTPPLPMTPLSPPPASLRGAYATLLQGDDTDDSSSEE
jgi:hypothetical protein